MKCEGLEHVPCRRCQATRTECIFDLIEAPKRQPKRQIEDDMSSSEKFRSLQDEIRDLREAVQSLSRATNHAVPELSLRSHVDVEETHFPPDGADGEHGRRVRRRTEYSRRHFSSEDTDDPSLGTTAAASVSVSRGSKMRERDKDQAATQTHETLTPGFASLASPKRQRSPEDLISKGLIPESLARELFERSVPLTNATRFQVRCNVYLPLFDPLTDTFESIRSRSSFCFAAILAIAARLPNASQFNEPRVMELCQGEARALAVETLFDSTPRVETVQGMILLAAYSQRCWHAVGHAVRLAQSIRLDESLSRLMVLLQTPSEPPTGIGLHTHTDGRVMAERINLMRQVRVWVTMAHLEQEIASGSGKQSLIEPDEVLNVNVRQLIQDPFYPRPDVHILAAIELLRHRGEHLKILGEVRIQGQILTFDFGR
ncbi:hypothetical protein A1O3_07181 [Capronia epimyces CBS 606.96]|uniref:Xylanolytic transcriptional activator regulatory domain-containing protein n=1 Tax=Capronia epimyces CBS 606.96 TaxID=1182542 RepID=W9XL38_9EURO|nr:uncharacterized protein A1O3_07181 [Capronia epimyces CBS 606.96]EXJ80893.1 hypothetical protein A1O3_07181 [Capronia epimyces CBS 606.96]